MKVVRPFLRWGWGFALLLSAPIRWLHEACHYLPALLFGMRPVMYRNAVVVTGGTRWQIAVVALSPTVVGALIACACYAALLASGPDRLTQLIWRLATSAGCCVAIGSIYDWRNLIAMYWKNTP